MVLEAVKDRDGSGLHWNENPKILMEKWFQGARRALAQVAESSATNVKNRSFS